MSGTPRHRAELHCRVAARVAGLEDDVAADWIAGHGLLSMAACEALPEGVRERLRESSRHVAAYNLYAIDRFRAISEALSKPAASGDPIPLCPLKGISLLDSVYRDDPGARPLADLDLLVPAERIDEAVARLRDELGLVERAMSRRLRRIYPERILGSHNLEVELHSRLGYKHGASSAWSDLSPALARVHGRRVHALDRETTLVHLVSHLVKHRPLSRLGWVEDVLRWSERGVDGARATAVAERIGARRSLIAGVRVLRRVVGGDLLPGVPDGTDRTGLGIALHERRLWREIADGALPDPPTGGTARSRSASLLSAVFLADRPSHALRALAVKSAELVLRGEPGR